MILKREAVADVDEEEALSPFPAANDLSAKDGVSVERHSPPDLGATPLSDEDPVVKVLKVLVTPCMGNKLHLLQFPTYKSESRKGYRPTAMRAKVRADLLELEHRMVTDPRVYDPERAAKLASYLDAATCDQAEYVPALDKMTLSSDKVLHGGRHYVGMVREDHFYLTPVESIIQFRPSLRYLDKIEEKMVESAQIEQLEREDGESDYEEQSKIISVTVESSDKMLNKLTRLAQLTQDAESEAWTSFDLTFCESYKETAEALCIKRPCYTLEASRSLYKPGEIGISAWKDEQGSPPLKPPKIEPGIPLSEYRNYSLCARIMAYILNATITRFDTLKMVINVSDEEEILKVLSRCAVLVHGIWIIKSELVYRGLPMLARKWLIYLFTTVPYVKRAEFSSSCRLPYEICTNILSEIAIFIPKYGWHLKLNEDINFCKKYPQLVSLQTKRIKEEGLESISRLTSAFSKI